MATAVIISTFALLIMARLEPFLLRTWKSFYFRWGIPVFWCISPLPQDRPDPNRKLAPSTDDGWQFHRIDSRLTLFCDGYMFRSMRSVNLKFVRGFIKVTEQNLSIVVFANSTAIMTVLLLTFILLLPTEFGLLRFLVVVAMACIIGQIVHRVLFIRSILISKPSPTVGAP